MSLSPPTIPQAVATIKHRWPEAAPDQDDQQPVFVLAAGWRSGSTLLQRMLFPRVFMWGEPYGHAGPIMGLAETIRAFTPRYPEPHFLHAGRRPEQLSQQFIANLFPSVSDLRAAHRAWFLTMFEQPARAAGIDRWGLKEVRLSIDHAHYLKWLFPRAKFLFLHRNPYDAFRSFAARRDAGWKWFRRWPDEPITTSLFARHWREMAGGFAKRHAEVGGLVVRYDELAAGRFETIEDYLGHPISREPAQVRPHDGPPPVETIAPADMAILEEELGVTAHKLRYESPCRRRKTTGTADRPGWGSVTTSEIGKTTGPRVTRETIERSRCAVLVPIGSHLVRNGSSSGGCGISTIWSAGIGIPMALVGSMRSYMSHRMRIGTSSPWRMPPGSYRNDMPIAPMEFPPP